MVDSDDDVGFLDSLQEIILALWRRVIQLEIPLSHYLGEESPDFLLFYAQTLDHDGVHELGGGKAGLLLVPEDCRISWLFLNRCGFTLTMIGPYSYALSGIVFGLVAGISPGPLLTLVISETLRHDWKEGVRVAVVPFITDAPLVLLSVLVLAKLSSYDSILGVISLLGSFFILYLAYETFVTKPAQIDLGAVQPRSYRKGILANFLSPHPYLFWILVGAPIVILAYEESLLSSILFVLGFYVCLVGSKVAVALLCEKSKAFLKSNWYGYAFRILGVILVLLAIALLKDGLEFLNIL